MAEFRIELNERTARQVLDAITRHATTVTTADALLVRCRELVHASQTRLDETIESVLAVREHDMPEQYEVKLDGLTMTLRLPDSPQGASPMPQMPPYVDAVLSAQRNGDTSSGPA